MWMCSSLNLRQFLLEILRSNRPLMHINLFVFERASRGYLTRLNRSPVEEVMAVLRTLRCPENLTRPGELLSYNSTRPGSILKLAKFQKLSPGRVHFQWINYTRPGPSFWRFSDWKRDFLEEENKKEELGQLYTFSTTAKHTHSLFEELLEED